MDNDILEQQEDFSEDSIYLTPYNVDLFSGRNKNYFSDYSNKVLALPESLRNILMDISTVEFVENLGQSLGLDKQQKTEVTRVIRDVILGELSINEVASRISDNLEIDPTVGYQIQSKIVSDLFGPAINDLTKNEPASPSKPIKPRYVVPQENPKPNQTPASNVVDLRNNQ